MADNEDAGLASDDKKEVLELARKRYQRAMDRERANIKLAYEDLEFLAGGQWPTEVETERNNEGRPVLTINQLPQFVHQVTGDIRQMKPDIKVVGVDDQSDKKMADLRGGMIRYIENRSDASGVYFRAADSFVACGIWHWRVETEYADDTTHEQEIRISPVDDGISVLWDPDAKRISRDDALFCFVPVDMTADAFKAQYPNANPASLEDQQAWGNYYTDWVTDDVVRVSEYWIKKPKKIKLGLTRDGQTIDITEDDSEFTAQRKEELVVANGGTVEERDSYSICRYLITASDVLEGPEEWMGRFIPIIPVVGEEVRIGRRVVRSGIVRPAKDAQRMYNYFRSAQTEVYAMQPKAPFMVTEKNVAKYQDIWETVNTKNYPYLPYEPDGLNGNAAPQRVQPPVSSQGISEGVEQANEDFRRVIGIYDASLGAKSNETSGKAIDARDQQGDTGTYLYKDNFYRALTQTAKIIIDLIPHVYDTQRTIRIMGEDGKVDLMQINQERDKAGHPMMDPQTGQPAILNDITTGSYDVIAEIGPNYKTKREEAREGMTAFMQAVPQAAPLILDLVAKAQDWPMSDKFASRARAMLPPQIAQAEALEEQGVPPEQVQQMMSQPQADPMVEMQQQAAQEMLQAQVTEAQAKTAQAEAGAQKAQADVRKAEAEAEKAELELEQMRRSSAVTFVRDIESHEMDLTHRDEQHQANLSRGDEQHSAKIERMKAPKEVAKQDS